MHTQNLFANSAQNPLLQQLQSSGSAADLFDADEANSSAPAGSALAIQTPAAAPAASNGASDLFGSDLLAALTALQSSSPESAGASPTLSPTSTSGEETGGTSGAGPASASEGGDPQTLAGQLQMLMTQFAQTSYASASGSGDPLLQSALASV